MRRGHYLVLVGLALAAAGWRWHALGGGRGVAKVRVPTATVTQGSLVVTLPVSGSLESAQETLVRSEIDGTLVDICKDNSPAKPGDFVYQLDTKDLTDQRDSLARDLTEAEQSLNTAETDGETRMAQAQADADSAQEALKLTQDKVHADVEKAKAQVKYREGETARVERELTRAQRLAKLNYIAGTKLREAEKAYRQQQFQLAQQRAQLADAETQAKEQVSAQELALSLARHSLDTAKADAEDHTQEGRIAVAEARRRLDQVEQKIQHCTVTTPVAGLAVIQINDANWPEHRPYRLGDQVSSGVAPVRVFDPGKMQVHCQIGEMDILRVHEGQTAYVTTPSRADKRYPGKVALVEELAQESNVWQGGTPGKKVFGVLVTLEQADPENLRPGMTVDLEIVLDNVRQATMAPIRAVFTEGKQPYVYLAQGDGFTRVPVTVGARNDLLVEIRGKVRAGERVALEPPPAPPARQGEVNR